MQNDVSAQIVADLETLQLETSSRCAERVSLSSNQQMAFDTHSDLHTYSKICAVLFCNKTSGPKQEKILHRATVNMQRTKYS